MIFVFIHLSIKGKICEFIPFFCKQNETVVIILCKNVNDISNLQTVSKVATRVVVEVDANIDVAVAA